MKILVDVGGSSVKIGYLKYGKLSESIASFEGESKPKTRDDFCKCILKIAGKHRISGIAISLAGEYDYKNEKVISCYHYPFLKGDTGDLRSYLQEQFKCNKVYIVNDGDAHTLALKEIAAREYGINQLSSAINMSFGTAVGFGVLDVKGNLLNTCQGHNWEVSGWHCDTRAGNDEMYWALGHDGLGALEKQFGYPTAYIYFGQRICHFVGRDLVPLFRPKVIGLSGGIVANHLDDIKEGIRRECEERGYRKSGGVLENVDVLLSQERHSVMLGLATFFLRTWPEILYITVRKRLDAVLKQFGKDGNSSEKSLVLIPIS